ncbi:MAG: hypothetical protein K6T86_06550 [Pirellulales bacterium]|nr:hypothetical protein [Pirellulales bacterium]
MSRGGMRGTPRAGFCLMVSLVLLAAAGVLAMQWLRELRAAQAAIDLQIRSRQAEWLAASGATLARARLRQDASYAGETWSPPLAAAAHVVITVQQVAGQPQCRRIRIVAQYGDAPLHQLRAQRIVVVPMNQGESRP